MAEEKNKNNSIANSVGNGARIVKTVAKAGTKLVAQDYVGAAVEVVKNFGVEIAIFLVALVIMFVTIFIGIFSSGPALVFGGISDWLENKEAELNITKAEKVIVEQVSKAENDVYKEMVKYIEDGYIPNVESLASDFKDGKTTQEVGDGYFFIGKEKNTNNALIFYLYGDTEYENKFARVVRIKDYFKLDDSSLDTLYLTIAFCVYHQNNDVGDDPDDDYVEPSDTQERWDWSNAKGLKKFLKTNRDKLFSAEYSGTSEILNISLSNNTVVSYNAEVLNISFKTINGDSTQSIIDLFGLNEDEIQTVNDYYEIAVALLETE